MGSQAHQHDGHMHAPKAGRGRLLLSVALNLVVIIAVLVSDVLVLFFDLPLADLLLTVGLSMYVLFQSSRMLKQAVSTLMERSPSGFDFEEMRARIRMIPGVQDLRHVHVWRLDESQLALEAHVLIERNNLQYLEDIKCIIKHRLSTEFTVQHSTLEFDFASRGPQVTSGGYEGAPVPS